MMAQHMTHTTMVNELRAAQWKSETQFCARAEIVEPRRFKQNPNIWCLTDTQI